MAQDKEQEIIEKVMAIGELIEHNTSKDEKLGNINYYKELHFQGGNAGLIAEGEVYVAKIENTAENTNTYEIYSGKTNTLIATVDEHGKLNFMPEYIEKCREIDQELAEALVAENSEFELPKELAENDRVFTREEIERISVEKHKEEKAKEENKEQEEKEIDEEQEEEQSDKSPEEEEQEEIASKKGIPVNNVLKVKPNSTFYKNYPQLEPNLYFYRDNDGIVRAEYIDENGISQPSKYFEPSNTSFRPPTISVGKDGNPIKKQSAYQVLNTKDLASTKEQAVMLTVYYDSYGYMNIEVAMQGKENGTDVWVSPYSLETVGRDDNSDQVRKGASNKPRNNNPDNLINASEKAENTGYAEDGVTIDEIHSVASPKKGIEEFIEEGYQRKEAEEIYNYITGPEALTEEQAKEKVNENIAEREKQREEQKAKENEDERGDDEEEYEGKVPWENSRRSH